MKVKSLAKDLRRLLVRGPEAAASADGPGLKKERFGPDAWGLLPWGLGYSRPGDLGERRLGSD